MTERQPERIQGHKVWGHNGIYGFECEYDDGYWCNIGGEEMLYWMPNPQPPEVKE